jgi:hypothetical protein
MFTVSVLHEILLICNFLQEKMNRDQHEFHSKLLVIDTLSMKTKRQLYSSIRGGASMHTFIPRLGMTFGEVCSYLVLRDKA